MAEVFIPSIALARYPLRQSEQAARPSVALVLHDTTAGIDGRDIASTADPPPLSASPSPRAQRSPSMGL
ncbi:hypothetical protein ACCO45_013325 [Purpureocillium lilacinum]|uniref:Uncharacterized protein n=1 Tax=Purpureocillium lilacinum TaxID=33203 RepID=A0ACC4DB53_PURLI